MPNPVFCSVTTQTLNSRQPFGLLDERCDLLSFQHYSEITVETHFTPLPPSPFEPYEPPEEPPRGWFGRLGDYFRGFLTVIIGILTPLLVFFTPLAITMSGDCNQCSSRHAAMIGGAQIAAGFVALVVGVLGVRAAWQGWRQLGMWVVIAPVVLTLTVVGARGLLSIFLPS